MVESSSHKLGREKRRRGEDNLQQDELKDEDDTKKVKQENPSSPAQLEKDDRYRGSKVLN